MLELHSWQPLGHIRHRRFPFAEVGLRQPFVAEQEHSLVEQEPLLHRSPKAEYRALALVPMLE